MKLLVSEFKEGVRIPVGGEYLAKEIDVEFPDFEYLSPVRVQGYAEKTMNVLRIDGQLTATIQQTCGRCVKKVPQEIREDFNWIFEIQGREEIDAIPNIREILIFDRPLVFLCKKDCLGLCPQCGKDLNEGPCQCNSNTCHPPFHVIKTVRSKKEKHNGQSKT